MGLGRQGWERELEGVCGCKRVGVYGGTFDPIHLGHLIVAVEALHVLHLDKVLFVPARISPLKQDARAVPAADRLEMVRLATKDNPKFAVSSIDISREGPSFTVETLELLSGALPGTELFFIMGMDSLLTFHRWRSPERIATLARLVVVSRPGSDWSTLHLNPALAELTRGCEVIDTLQIGISSTDIRARVQSGLPVRYQIPPAVECYIRQHQLYL